MKECVSNIASYGHAFMTQFEVKHRFCLLLEKLGLSAVDKITVDITVELNKGIDFIATDLKI